jgi:hypothetical protein
MSPKSLATINRINISIQYPTKRWVDLERAFDLDRRQPKKKSLRILQKTILQYLFQRGGDLRDPKRWKGAGY